MRPEELTDQQRELIGGDGPQLNIFLTLARYPGLLRKWLPFGGKLLAGGKLTPRDRELVILRSAFRCHARYEWEAARGTHEIRVRATDGTGRRQTADEAPPPPDGATGYHTVVVDVT